MYTYKQSTGELFNGNKLLGSGYAGKGIGKNDPAMQSIHDIGPLPRGVYMMTDFLETSHLGLGAIKLLPKTDNEMFGRSAFYIHGTDPNKPEESSDGCICYGHAGDRKDLYNKSEDKLIEVIA